MKVKPPMPTVTPNATPTITFLTVRQSITPRMPGSSSVRRGASPRERRHVMRMKTSGRI
jgi:hypothetical protein